MQRTTRYQGAILKDHHLLLLKVVNHTSGNSFWLIPGGGREAHETEKECVQREVLEETHLHVAVGRLVLDEPAIADDTYERLKTYACHIVSGEPRPGTEPEVSAGHLTIADVGWFDLRDPTSWGSPVLGDPITHPRLQRLRSALGYAAEEEAV